MNKPTLTKEQAEAIESRLQAISRGDVSRKLTIETYLKRSYDILQSIPFDDFVVALYIGYTVEQTPEEKVREMVEVLREKNDFIAVSAVTQTLNAYGHVVEGVNDK